MVVFNIFNIHKRKFKCAIVYQVLQQAKQATVHELSIIGCVSAKLFILGSSMESLYRRTEILAVCSFDALYEVVYTAAICHV